MLLKSSMHTSYIIDHYMIVLYSNLLGSSSVRARSKDWMSGCTRQNLKGFVKYYFSLFLIIFQYSLTSLIERRKLCM